MHYYAYHVNDPLPNQPSTHILYVCRVMECPSNAGPSRRLEVLHGHLKPPPTYSCSGAVGSGKSKKLDDVRKVGSSAPMSSSKDEVQKAFPRARYNKSATSAML